MNDQFRQMSPDELRSNIRNLAGILTATTGELAVCLHVVALKRYWELWEFESMDAYAEEELGIKKPSLIGYLSAGKVAVERNLTLQQVKALGKGKLAAMVTVASTDKFGKAIEFAQNHTETELKNYCQTLTKGGNVNDRTVKTWTVKMAADDFEEAQRLATMIQLENDFKLNGDAILKALRQYWQRIQKAA